jgi:hypothetical protein
MKYPIPDDDSLRDDAWPKKGWVEYSVAWGCLAAVIGIPLLLYFFCDKCR